MSSYSSPAAQGSAQGTGLYSVTIAAQAGGTNADGNATDSAGNLVVDRVWGNFPLQPNDERNGSVSNTGGSDYDHQWAATTKVASTSLAYGDVAVTVGNNPTRTVPMDSHNIAEANWASFPSFASTHQAAYIITQASGDGSTQTYTAPNNFLKAGDTINITGTGLDGTNLTVASANRYTFTVSGSGTGSYINISGKARYADEVTANDGSFVSGVDYVTVPNVLGASLANAQKALNDAELVVTTASAFTPVISAITLTSNVASVTATAHGYAVNDVVTIAGLTNGSGSANADADLNGTYTITVVPDADNFRFAKTHANITSHSGLSGNTAKVAARANTIKTQSVAGGTASVSAGSAITITPYFAS